MNEKLRKLQAVDILFTALRGTPFDVKYIHADDGVSGMGVITVQLLYDTTDIVLADILPTEEKEAAQWQKDVRAYSDETIRAGEASLQQNGTQAPKRRRRQPTLHATLHVEPAQPSVKPHAPMPRRVTAPKPPTVESEEDIDPFLDDE